jgi:hypothetical protein
MKKLIHRYLNENFYVEGNCLYSRNKKISYCLGSIALIDELGKVFSMTKPQLKWFVKSWIHKQNKGFSFRNFWTPKPTGFDNIAFPLIRRVAAQTIGLDLVSVQPLPAPSGLLRFLDYQYGIDPVDNNNQGYVFAPYIPVETTPVAYTGSPMHELTTRYAAREVNPNYYGRINISGETGTTTDLEKMRKETIKK